jgi:hypothetical protein
MTFDPLSSAYVMRMYTCILVQEEDDLGYKLARYTDAIYSYLTKEFCYGTSYLTKIEYNVK